MWAPRPPPAAVSAVPAEHLTQQRALRARTAAAYRDTNLRWLGATPAFTLVLHTWTQDLRRHIHVHALMACDGLDGQGRWCAPKRNPTFLFPVHALSKVLRGKLLDALGHAGQAGKLPHDPASRTAAGMVIYGGALSLMTSTPAV